MGVKCQRYDKGMRLGGLGAKPRSGGKPPVRRSGLCPDRIALGMDRANDAADMAPQKLILRNFQSPGDILMLTAAVRDLHACHPGEFLTDVRTSCADLWLNNPYLTPLR